jgi:hypothetical protein
MKDYAALRMSPIRSTLERFPVAEHIQAQPSAAFLDGKATRTAALLYTPYDETTLAQLRASSRPDSCFTRHPWAKSRCEFPDA